MKKLKFVICCVAALFVLAPQAVFADPINVLNPSFEYSGGEDIDVKTMGICPDDWTYDPVTCIGLEAGQTTGIPGEPVEDGVCVALYGVESIFQTTDHTIGPGDEYTLMFDAFWLWQGGTEVTYQGQLYYDDAGNRELLDPCSYVEESITGGMDWVWHTDITLNVTVPLGSPAIGKKLGVELATTVFGPGWFGFDTVRLDVETALSAMKVYPLDDAEYVPVTAVLEWAPPPLYTPIYYEVYLSDSDPNADKPWDMVMDANQLTYDPPGDLAFNTEYWWRVVSYETYDANYPGSVWSFTTMPAEPVFTTDAEHALVAAGDSAVFNVVSPNAGLGFKWYREPATLLTHGGDGGDISIVSDATSSTLTISNVEAADEDFYYCVAENSYDTTDSTHAKLEIAKVLAHWTMDSPLLSGQYYKDETLNHHADPNKPSEVSFTAGIIGGAQGAVEMNNFRWANAGSWRPNEYSGQMTVSAWIKVPDANDILYPQGIVSKRVGDSMEWTLDLTNEKGVGFESWNGGAVWSDIDIFGEDWVYVVATVDGAGAARMYINGALQGVDDSWVYGTNEDADILIGKGNPDDYVFPGMIDDVKIRNYAQDGYAIAADYTDVAGGSICVEPIPGDYNGDCKVNLADIAELALIWLDCNIIPASACP